MLSRIRPLRFAAVGLVVATMAGSAYAFTASGSVPNSVAAYGNGSVAGFTVSDVDYTFQTDNTYLATIVMDLTADLTSYSPTIKVNGGSLGDISSNCVLNASDVTCTAPGATAWPTADLTALKLTVHN